MRRSARDLDKLPVHDLMKFFFMLVRRNASAESPVLADLFHTLVRRGHEVETGIAEEMILQPERLATAYDLIVLKSHTELSLSLASILHDQGTHLLNPYPACVAAQDKIFVAHRLRAAGVPAPRHWVTGDLSLLQSVAQTHPLIIKPYRGFGGAGIRIAHNPDELEAIPPLDRPVLAQEYIEGTGQDLKVYVVGDRVFAVRKTFSETSYAQAGESCQVGSEVEEIARRCGQIFGLGLYGLDIIESVNGPVVVDLNYFPGYKGIPGIATLLADYIEAYARGHARLEFPGPAWQIETVNSWRGNESLFSLR